jgi:quercetin dioxygenase-like cupin family protein
MDVLVDLEELPWTSSAPGVRDKIAVRGDRRVRLVEFSEDFVEMGWCTSGHEGQVLEGELTIRFASGGNLRAKRGDIILIPAGEEHAHRPEMQQCERALLLFFEDA